MDTTTILVIAIVVAAFIVAAYYSTRFLSGISSLASCLIANPKMTLAAIAIIAVAYCVCTWTGVI